MEPAGGGLQKLMLQVLRSAPKDELPLLAWAVVCGSAVAERTQALELADGVLRVQVPDAAWRNQLQGFSKRYLEGLNALMKSADGPEVRGIAFVICNL